MAKAKKAPQDGEAPATPLKVDERWVEEVKKVAKLCGDEELMTAYNDVQFRPGQVWSANARGMAWSRLPGSTLDLATPGKALVRALGALEEVDRAEYREGRLRLSHGHRRAELAVGKTEGAPELWRPEEGAVWTPVHGWSAAVKRVAPFVSQDQTRPHLCGVAVLPGGALAATDGSAMAVAYRVVDPDFVRAAILIPPGMLAGLPDDVYLTRHEGRLFAAEDVEKTSYRGIALINAEFPPVENIVSTVQDLPAITVLREEILDAAKRIKASGMAITITSKGSRLQLETEDAGPAQQFSLFDQVGVEGDWPEGRVSLAVGYLISALEAAQDERITLRCKPEPSGALSPFVIEAAAYLAIVMPRRM